MSFGLGTIWRLGGPQSRSGRWDVQNNPLSQTFWHKLWENINIKPVGNLCHAIYRHGKVCAMPFPLFAQQARSFYHKDIQYAGK
jgi:hypothetical protein